MTNIPRDKKKSDFIAQTTIPADSTFDFVSNGTNYKITESDMISEFGVTGSLEQLGNPVSVPVLKVVGSTNQIRNIESGSGIESSISVSGGVQLDHNFVNDTTGAEILKNPTADQPIFRSLVAGSGISVAEQSGFIQIALSATPVATKTVIVNQESDFPTAVAGVITLEDNINYFVTNDITTASRFVLGSNTVVSGSDGTLITLTSTNSGAMFTSVDNSNKIKDIICTCASGSFVDISCTGGTSFFQVNNARINCDEIGTIDNLGVVSFQNIVWDVTTDGLTLLNNNAIVSFFQNLGTISAGTFLDLGSSTFDGFSFSTSQGTLAAGTTFLSGLSGSGNVNAGGLATVINTRATGSGTPLSGITAVDSLWEFFGNNGITDSINSLLATHSGATITIAAPNTPVIIDNTWSYSHPSRFSGNANGIMTYTGKGAHINISATVTATIATAIDDVTFYIYKNGIQEALSGVQRSFSAGTNGNLNLLWQLDVETNDTISVYVENNDTSVNVIVVKIILDIS